MTPQQIARFKRLGWQFRSEDYTDHHKGTPETSYYAKSPRMKSEALICCPYRPGVGRNVGVPWKDATEEEMLQWEAQNRAYQLGQRKISGDDWRDRDKELLAHFLKNPEAKTITLTFDLP